MSPNFVWLTWKINVKVFKNAQTKEKQSWLKKENQSLQKLWNNCSYMKTVLVIAKTNHEKFVHQQVGACGRMIILVDISMAVMADGCELPNNNKLTGVLDGEPLMQ